LHSLRRPRNSGPRSSSAMLTASLDLTNQPHNSTGVVNRMGPVPPAHYRCWADRDLRRTVYARTAGEPVRFHAIQQPATALRFRA
jgi:hypothetical protein